MMMKQNSVGRIAVAMLLSALFANTSVTAASSQSVRRESAKGSAQLTENQRILHVLNRLGFGARPGDLERVRAIGIDKYVEQQLQPEKIDDAASEARLKNLDSLRMSTADLFEKYPQPGQLLRQLQQRGALPADLAAARDNRTKGNANATSNAETKPRATGEMDVSKTVDVPKKPAPSANTDPMNNPEYRRAVYEYYKENNLRPAQFITGELQMSRILRAVYSERQLQEVMVDFWTNHFNVFANKGADRWYLTSYDRDTIRPHTLGKFYDLLLADAQSPAMLFYLDNVQSVSPNAQPPQQRPLAARPLAELMRMTNNPAQQRPQQPRRGINENYARELMELHTLGVDGGYTQKDVQEVARCFTGWTILQPRGGAVAAMAVMGRDARGDEGTFIFRPLMHDNGEKNVLGHKIPAGGGIKDGLMVLDILSHHPSTAKFIATKLVRHFVSDEPPPALVDRVAQTFLKTDGDIREMLRTIFFSREFNSAQAYRAKIKRPFELVVSAVRTLGAETNGGPQLHNWIARMGQPLYGFQTPNGYSDVAENWVNTGALLERMNFSLALVSNRIPGTRVDLSSFVNTTDSKPPDKNEVLNLFVRIIVGDELSAKTRETLLKQLGDGVVMPPAPPAGQIATVNSPANPFETGFQMGVGFNAPAQQQAPRPPQVAAVSPGTINNPVIRMAGLILGSPEFQRQ